MTDRVIIPFGPEVLIFTESELAEARRRGRQQFVSQVAASTSQIEETALVDAKRIATEFSLPLTCIYEYAKSGRIPSVRVGRHVRFDKHQVRAALEGR